MEEQTKTLELEKFCIQDSSTPIFQTRESKPEHRELTRFLIQILCITQAVSLGYSGGSSGTQHGEERARAGDHPAADTAIQEEAQVG